MGTNRREFLRVLAVAPAAALLPQLQLPPAALEEPGRIDPAQDEELDLRRAVLFPIASELFMGGPREDLVLHAFLVGPKTRAPALFDTAAELYHLIEELDLVAGPLQLEGARWTGRQLEARPFTFLDLDAGQDVAGYLIAWRERPLLYTGEGAFPYTGQGFDVTIEASPALLTITLE